jgi:hypothetical protein
MIAQDETKTSKKRVKKLKNTKARGTRHPGLRRVAQFGVECSVLQEP